MTEPDRTEPPTVPGRHAAREGRHRVAHQPVPAPPAPSWLPRTALGAAMAVAVGVGILATTSAASTPS
ncbi:MAG: hypothetical protein QOE53_1500, partial [Pseudonocardiales bacterium]|nr:hypothetical protein [Pseudonocardiales bacterium]